MEKHLSNLLASMDNHNFGVHFKILEDYYASVEDVFADCRILLTVLNSAIEKEAELKLNSTNLLKLFTLRNKIKTRVNGNRSNAFSKRPLKNLIIKCKISGRKDLEGEEAILKIKNFIKRSAQNEHCCAFSELTSKRYNS